MNERGQLIRGIVCVLVFVLLALSFSDARADISAKQARKAITRMPGFELKNGAVRVSSVSSTTASTAEVTASIQSVFRFEKNQEGFWRVAEIRTAPDTWEDIDLLGRVLGVNVITSDCNAPVSPRAALDPSVKRTRCLLGSLFGIDIPSDQVRIQEVAPFAVPLASRPSTTVIAWIQIGARLVKEEKSDWKVTEVKTGKRDWINVETVFAAVNDEKRKTARADLEVIAQALEKFRSERGYYWVADKESVLIDHLSPRYLSRVIRLDPWRQPYIYQGQRDRFTLTSSGPDRKEATGDDIILSGGAR
jgi:hypothetical protein